MPDFAVMEIRGDQLGALVPLVRLASPDLCSDAWQRTAEAARAMGGGVIAVTAGGSLFYGVATYEPREAVGGGSVLHVDDIITVELNRRAPVRSLLKERLALIARGLGCRSVAGPSE